jgi:GT2 family glycosyltransferase
MIAAQSCPALAFNIGPPIKVMVVDIERCPAEISAEHPDGGRYQGVWLLARVGGEPRRLIKLPFVGDRITRADLAPHLRALTLDGRTASRLTLPESPPQISVVVCTMFERGEEIRSCLESLAALDYPAFEVLVVDNRRDEDGGSVDWVESIPGVRLLRERRPGVAAAKNRGLNAAAGAIVAFTDDDVVVDRGWLTAFARRFSAHPEEVGVGGLTLPKELETQAQIRLEEYYGSMGPRIMEPVSHRLERLRGRGLFRTTFVVERNDEGELVDSFSLYSPTRFGGGVNMAFRTETLRATGGFDVVLGPGTPTRGGEDIILWMRLAWRGYSLGFEPAALVFHVHRREDEQLQRQISNNGVGFAATMVAIVIEDPRHLAALVAAAPQVLSALGRSFWKKLQTQTPPQTALAATSSVSDLARLELCGMLKGPAAYFRSRRRARQWRA